jgi:hypothetical protein
MLGLLGDLYLEARSTVPGAVGVAAATASTIERVRLVADSGVRSGAVGVGIAASGSVVIEDSWIWATGTGTLSAIDVVGGTGGIAKVRRSELTVHGRGVDRAAVRVGTVSAYGSVLLESTTATDAPIVLNGSSAATAWFSRLQSKSGTGTLTNRSSYCGATMTC